MNFIFFYKWFKEIQYRFYYIFFNIILTLIVINYNIKRLINIVLYPLIEINYNLDKSIYKKSFINIDSYKKKNTDWSFTYENSNYIFDSIPSFEINIPIYNTTNLYLIVTILSSFYFIIPYIIYQLFLYLNSLKNKKKRKNYYFFFFSFFSMCLNIYYIIPYLIKLNLHNYKEYIYFEFDIGIDFKNYIYFFFIISFYTMFISLVILYEIKKILNIYRVFYFFFFIITIKLDLLISFILTVILLFIAEFKIIFFCFKKIYKKLNDMKP